MRIQTHMYTYTYLYICVYVCMYMYVCMYACMNVYTQKCAHTHTHAIIGLNSSKIFTLGGFRNLTQQIF